MTTFLGGERSFSVRTSSHVLSLQEEARTYTATGAINWSTITEAGRNRLDQRGVLVARETGLDTAPVLGLRQEEALYDEGGRPKDLNTKRHAGAAACAKEALLAIQTGGQIPATQPEVFPNSQCLIEIPENILAAHGVDYALQQAAQQ